MDSIIQRRFRCATTSFGVILTFMAGCLFPLAAQQGNDENSSSSSIDKTIRMKVKPGQLKFSTNSFTVPAGGRIKLIFKNNGSLKHNLVLCTPGNLKLAMKVAKKAWNMKNPQKNEYVPKSKKVLKATKMLNPGQKESLVFTAPENTGDHPYVCTFPGHAQTMRGLMHVKSASSDSDQKQQNGKGKAGNETDTDRQDQKPDEASGAPVSMDLSYKYFEGKWDSLPNFDELEPVKSGPVQNVNDLLSTSKKNIFFSMVLTGKIKLPSNGTYTFFLSADNGARLFIDGTRVINHDYHKSSVITVSGKRELTAGTHEIRIEYVQSKGDQRLELSVAGPGIDGVHLFGQRPFEVVPKKLPRVMRVILPDAPPVAFAVGMPGYLHYCFDPERCTIRYGWYGAFLDVGPERGYGKSRGGRTSRILGQRFSVGLKDKQPLRFESVKASAKPEFLGYTRGNGMPVMKYRLDGKIVHLRVSPSKNDRGLRLNYRFRTRSDKKVYFELASKKGVRVSASKGNWKNNTLHLPAGTQTFRVTLIPENSSGSQR